MFNKLFSQKRLISLSIAVALFVFIGKYSAITAQSQNSNNRTEIRSFNPPTPEDNGAPSGKREGAGSHGLCQITNQDKDTAPLIAIMPEIPIQTPAKNKVYVWGETTSPNPSFWFYLAYPVNSQIEFILQDEAENEVYQTIFSLDKTLGIISFTLPQDKVKLEKGKSYHWYLYIMCNPENSPDDFVEGWVKRVELSVDINNQIQLAQPLERISIYAENGLWFDTLSSIDRLRQTESKNKAIDTIWTDLLQQVGLDEVSQEPIVKRYNKL